MIDIHFSYEQISSIIHRNIFVKVVLSLLPRVCHSLPVLSLLVTELSYLPYDGRQMLEKDVHISILSVFYSFFYVLLRLCNVIVMSMIPSGTLFLSL